MMAASQARHGPLLAKAELSDVDCHWVERGIIFATGQAEFGGLVATYAWDREHPPGRACPSMSRTRVELMMPVPRSITRIIDGAKLALPTFVAGAAASSDAAQLSLHPMLAIVLAGAGVITTVSGVLGGRVHAADTAAIKELLDYLNRQQGDWKRGLEDLLIAKGLNLTSLPDAARSNPFAQFYLLMTSSHEGLAAHLAANLATTAALLTTVDENAEAILARIDEGTELVREARGELFMIQHKLDEHRALAVDSHRMLRDMHIEVGTLATRLLHDAPSVLHPNTSVAPTHWSLAYVDASSFTLREGIAATRKNPSGHHPSLFPRDGTVILGDSNKGPPHNTSAHTIASWDIPVKGISLESCARSFLLFGCVRHFGGLHSPVPNDWVELHLNGDPLDGFEINIIPEGQKDYFHQRPYPNIPIPEPFSSCSRVYAWPVANAIAIAGSGNIAHVVVSIDKCTKWDIDYVGLLFEQLHPF